jgi:hypothetical protein
MTPEEFEKMQPSMPTEAVRRQRAAELETI